MAVILGNKRGSKQVTDGHVYMRFDWEIINQYYETGVTEISWTLTAGLEEGTQTGSDSFLGIGVTISNYLNSQDYKTSIGVNAGGLDRFTLFAGEEKIIHSGVHKITNTWDEGSNSTLQANFTLWYSQVHTFSSGNQLFYVRGVTPWAFCMDSPDFNDAQDLTFSFICPQAFEGYITFNLLLNGFLIRSDRIQNPGNGLHSYAFVFTDEERARMYEAMGTATSTSYVLQTESWGYAAASYAHQDIVTGGFKVTDSAPVLNPEAVDINPVTLALTGNQRVLVKHWSNVQATIRAEAVKGAVLTEYGVTNGAFTYLNSDPVVIENVENNIFVFHATDNKGQTTKKTVALSMVDYIKLTTKVVANAPSGEGDMNVQVTGTYYPGSFGETDNELFVYFRYKEQGAEEFNDWITFENVTINEDGTYTASAYLDGLDYQATYIFQSQAADAIDTVTSVEYVVATTPIFDWGKNDFNFNVPVTIQGKRIGGANEVLWSGKDQMLANASIELSEPISQQMHGIVLVFSNINGDMSWNTAYVPKEMINFYNGGGHSFLMAGNSGLASFGAKYLYITDEAITGHVTNGDRGVGASNISFQNEMFVLRYVIGV